MVDSYGPFEPLEKRLGSREAFEAHQKSEAERTARVLARRAKAWREFLWTLAKGILAIVLVLVALGLIVRALVD